MADFEQIARGLAEIHASPYPPSYIPIAAQAIAAALREAHAAGVAEERERSKWQSIEFAPRDGTPFLGYSTEGAMFVTWHHEGGWAFYHNPGDVTMMWAPTHWQPLVSPPAAREGS